MKRWWGKGKPVYYHPLFLFAVAAILVSIFVGPPSHGWPWPWLLDMAALLALFYLGWKKVDWNS